MKNLRAMEAVRAYTWKIRMQLIGHGIFSCFLIALLLGVIKWGTQNSGILVGCLMGISIFILVLFCLELFPTVTSFFIEPPHYAEFNKSEVLSKEEFPRLHDTLKFFSKHAGFKDVKLYKNAEISAAFGRRQAISLGSHELETYAHEELHAVIGHEMAHLHFKDERGCLWGMLATSGSTILQWLWTFPKVLTCTNSSFVEILGKFLFFRIMQLQEYRADAWTVAVSNCGNELIEGLKKFPQQAGHMLPTHPRIEERVAAIRSYYD